MRRNLKNKTQASGTNWGPNMNVQNEETFTDNILAINPSGT